ncbi:MAG: hypothetical protein JO332_09585 [Planctomycetaceae bacterium]|nr:hypothetical protein [Planctomycetaceae bacterium]
MQLGELLDRIRDYYLQRLRTELREAPKPIAEPAFRKKDGSLAREGPLSLPLRGDLYAHGEMIAVDTEKMLAFDALEFPWTEDLTVDLEPFKWNELTLHLAGVGSCVDWAPLTAWFEKWFDGDDEREPGPDGLRGVLHFLSDPETHDDEIRFMIDLGSAPVEAFEELLDAADALGAPRVRID